MKVAYLFDFYRDILSDKQQLAVDLYYNEDLSLSEVAAQLGISRQGVRDSLKRSESALFDMESKLGLAAKFRCVLDDIESIERLALSIEGSPRDVDFVRSSALQIADFARKLEEMF